MRHRKIRDIVIELTSLLDVVMILIFAVMIKNTEMAKVSSQEASRLQEENVAMKDDLAKYEEIKKELAEAQEKLAEGGLETTLEKLHNTEKQLNAYQYMDDIVIVYNIVLENHNTTRNLSYGLASDKNLTVHSIKRDAATDWKYEIDTLKLKLKEFIDKELEEKATDKYIYLVFMSDEEKIYQNDYYNIENILQGFETTYGGKVIYKHNSLGKGSNLE